MAHFPLDIPRLFGNASIAFRFKAGFFILLSAFMLPAQAEIVTDAALPEVHIKEDGELILKESDIRYAPWQSGQLTDKVYVIQHIAGRSAAKEMNAPLIDRIKAADLPDAYYQTVTVVNTDDAIWGTGGIVKGKLENSKKEFPWSMMVLDEEGVARSVWNLEEDSSAIIVVDRSNQVRWAKDGVLSDAEQQEVMSLIQTLLP